MGIECTETQWKALVGDTPCSVAARAGLLGIVTWGEITGANQKRSLNCLIHMLLEYLTHGAIKYQGIWSVPWVHRPYQLCSLLSPSLCSLHHLLACLLWVEGSEQRLSLGRDHENSWGQSMSMGLYLEGPGECQALKLLHKAISICVTACRYKWVWLWHPGSVLLSMACILCPWTAVRL